MAGLEWVYLEDEDLAIEVPSDWVRQGSFNLPGQRRTSITACLADGARLHEPIAPRRYLRAYPRRYEHVMTQTVVMHRGTPLAKGPQVGYAAATVFERCDG